MIRTSGRIVPMPAHAPELLRKIFICVTFYWTVTRLQNLRMVSSVDSKLPQLKRFMHSIIQVSCRPHQ